MSAESLAVQARYVAREAGLAFRRNGLMSLAAVTTLMVTLLVVAASVVAVANLRHLAATLETQVEIVVYLKPDVSETRRGAIAGAIRAVPGVAAATFVSKDEALGRLERAYAGEAALGDLVETNPLPDSFDVAVAPGADVAAAARAIQAVGGVDEVSYGVEAVGRLLSLTRAVRWLGAAGAGLLMIVALIITVNTIRLTVIARRAEIAIMTLVGASTWHVRLPFLLEGALQGLLGAAAAAGVAVPAYELVARWARGSFPFLPVLGTSDVAAGVVATVCGAGVAMGVAGSAIATRRFLRA